MGRRRLIPVEHVRMLQDASHMLVQVSLATTGHDELWGALHAAKAVVEQCCRIATRDVDRSTLPTPTARRRKARR